MSSTLDKMQEQITKLQNELNELKQTDYVLGLKVECGEILIGYYVADKFCEIGSITEDGLCYILSSASWVDNYNQWVKNGMRHSNKSIEWRGKKYLIQSNFLKCEVELDSGYIYNFKHCQPVSQCKDDNIQRYENNKTPIIL